MKRVAALFVFLAVALQPATTQAPNWTHPMEREWLEELARMVKEDLVKSWCGRIDDGDRRAQCLRDIESCTWPLGASATCADVLRRLSRDALCSADDFEKDKVACLERQVDALTRELADLRRDLPRLIEEGVQRAMEPRLHR